MYENIKKGFLEATSGGGGASDVGGGGAADETPTEVVLFDITGSTFCPFHDTIGRVVPQQRKHASLKRGRGFVVHQTMVDDLRGEFPSAAAGAADAATAMANAGLDALLAHMLESHHPYVMASISAPGHAALLEETSNPVETALGFAKTAWNDATSNPENVGCGTSIVVGIDAILGSEWYKRRTAVPKGERKPFRLLIYTDGTCSDGAHEIDAAFARLLKALPEVIIDIKAFVLGKPPAASGAENQAAAGFDLFDRLKNQANNISSFRAYYVFDDVLGGMLSLSAAPTERVLACGSTAGARARFGCLNAEVTIPADAKEREALVGKLANVLVRNRNELKLMSMADLKDILHDLDSLGAGMAECHMRNLLTVVMTTWVVAKGMDADKSKAEVRGIVRKALDGLIFGPKMQALIDGCATVLRTQDQRQADFKKILGMWDERGVPVLNHAHDGTTLVLVDTADVGRLVSVKCTPAVRADWDNKSGLWRGRYLALLTNAGDDTYARLAARRYLSALLCEQGYTLPKVPNVQKMGMRIEMAAAVVLLAVVSRRADAYAGQPAGETTLQLTELARQMLDKEQLDQKTRRTTPSCYYLLTNGLPIPDEQRLCAALGTDPEKTMRYALGLDAAPPDDLRAKLSPVMLRFDAPRAEPLVDTITMEDIDGPHYRHRRTPDWTVLPATLDGLIGMRSHVHDRGYERDDFEAVDKNAHQTMVNAWAERPGNEGLPLRGLLELISSRG